jgi:GTP diphosphokinase / guanosine-3',5'-bis(diphosphate) 3'-diphosphatase
MNELINRAITFAVKAHGGQLDKAGQPYILHPLRVMLSMKTETGRICAVLHDVLEDTDVTKNDIIGAFGVDIYAVVETLTKRKDEDYFDYIKRIRPHPTAKAVKLADLHDNMDLGRMAVLRDKKIESEEVTRNRYGKYMKAIGILTLVRKSKDV